MTAISHDDLGKNIRSLPSLPVIVIDLLNSFEQEDINLNALAEKVSRDQALAAKTLRLANSSFYGLSRKVATIQQAITVLGFDSVRALITAAAATDVFSSSVHPAFDFKSFWQHAASTAVCSKLLARSMNLNQNYAFITGLLHDVGTLVLVTRFPEQYAAAVAYRISHDCHQDEAERVTLGLDHTVAGQALATHWKFPVLMQMVIANHHAPRSQDLGDIASVIHAADAIVHALDLPRKEDAMVPTIVENAWNSLRIPSATLHAVFRQTELEFEEVCQLLLA
ncbi:HDOD domain-containing protein [Noviherbaspirillum suwonense]|uniref:HDIG domain-containing protein n=1 Tax=Noviherbaspirillum suwonense TaxID=1224511 RepID=A0ABY1QQ46_9BURK|nr:HDOD domain-containing protein [Noviherbaspirillum suwonense]SMP77166.1 HDIG domain-containing protein [Noviherbaspirillum suwonense]